MTARAILAAGALLLTTLPAGAQTPHDDGATVSIAGSWSFETEVYDGGGSRFGPACKMTGVLDLRATSDPNVLEGRLVANERCEGGISYEAEQTSIARRDGEQLVIESTIVSVRPLPVSYAPDNFALFIVNGSLMVGELRSADIAPATFRRNPDLIG